MYEVMARRYRPALFDDVVGQEHIASTLKNAITRGRVAHAFIFTGGHGCGKTTMARILAKALVCQTGPTPNPCCTCPICVDVAAGRDADVLEIDGASNNGIEQIRTLREQAAYVPTRARFKIYIIDEVHMLSDGAFNALLKTLEEPPPHVKFILATTDPHKVPDTILSRCQRFDFRLVPQPVLAAFFRKLASKENAAITDDALDAVAAFSGGSVRDGLVLLDQLLSFSDSEVTRQDVENLRGAAAAESVAGIYDHIANSNVKAALALVDEVASRGTNAGDFLDQLIAFGRDLMFLIASGGAATGGISAYGPAKETLFNLAKQTDLESALLYLDIFAAARTRVRQRALTNPMVSLEMAVARLAGLGGITPVSTIIEKLENLPQGALATIANPQPAQTPAPAPVQKPAEQEQQTTPNAVPEPAPTTAPDPLPDKPESSSDRQPESSALQQEESAPPAVAAQPEPVANSDPAPMQTPEVQDPNTVQYPFEPDTPSFSPSATHSDTISDGGEVTSEMVKAAWSEILDRVAEKHASDLGHVLRTIFEKVEDGVIVFSGSRTTVEAWEDKRRLGRLTATVEEVLGRPVSFKFVARKERRKREEIENNRQMQRNLVNNPVVDSVRSLFDGVIIAHRSIESAAESGEPEDSDADSSDNE